MGKVDYSVYRDDKDRYCKYGKERIMKREEVVFRGEFVLVFWEAVF